MRTGDPNRVRLHLRQVFRKDKVIGLVLKKESSVKTHSVGKQENFWNNNVEQINEENANAEKCFRLFSAKLQFEV